MVHIVFLYRQTVDFSLAFGLHQAGSIGQGWLARPQPIQQTKLTNHPLIYIKLTVQSIYWITESFVHFYRHSGTKLQIPIQKIRCKQILTKNLQPSGWVPFWREKLHQGWIGRVSSVCLLNQYRVDVAPQNPGR